MTSKEHALTPATYNLVCAVLILLTIGTVSFSFAPVHGLWHIVFGLIIGGVKASLVLLFFMHVLISDRITWCVIAVAIFWLGTMLVLTLADYYSRDLIPFMQGH